MNIFVITALIAGVAVGFVIGFASIWMYCCGIKKENTAEQK